MTDADKDKASPDKPEDAKAKAGPAAGMPGGRPGVVSIPHGWAQANANLLTDGDAFDPIAGYPEDKGLLCRLSKI